MATMVSRLWGFMVMGSTGILSQVAADAGILALRVLGHDHPVELGTRYVSQGTGDTRRDPGRADVGWRPLDRTRHPRLHARDELLPLLESFGLKHL